MGKTLHHFGLRHFPLDKGQQSLWDDGALEHLQSRFQWLLESPGVGVITGEPGVGKTAALRHLAANINTHQYQLTYLAETDFGRLDLYRSLAQELGLNPAWRRSQMWREIKQWIEEQVTHQSRRPIWIIDEAQNLPAEFFRDFPAFINFAFDSKDLLTVWFVGHPELARLLDRQPYAALSSRIQVRLELKAITQRERFRQLIQHGFEAAGTTQTLLSDSGIELIHQNSGGIPRKACRLITTTMRLAADKGINHLPDDLILQAIEELK